MKRRDFLKICSSLPFIGSLFAQGASVASEGQPEEPIELPVGPLAQFQKAVDEQQDIADRIRGAIYEIDALTGRKSIECIAVTPEVSDYLEKKKEQKTNCYYWGEICKPNRYFMDIPVIVQDINIFNADAVIAGKAKYPWFQKILYKQGKPC